MRRPRRRRLKSSSVAYFNHTNKVLSRHAPSTRLSIYREFQVAGLYRASKTLSVKFLIKDWVEQHLVSWVRLKVRLSTQITTRLSRHLSLICRHYSAPGTRYWRARCAGYTGRPGRWWRLGHDWWPDSTAVSVLRQRLVARWAVFCALSGTAFVSLGRDTEVTSLCKVTICIVYWHWLWTCQRYRTWTLPDSVVVAHSFCESKTLTLTDCDV